MNMIREFDRLLEKIVRWIWVFEFKKNNGFL